MLPGPSVSPNITLLVTHIGSHIDIVNILVAQGYQVHGTACLASKLDYLKGLGVKKYSEGHFEVAVVEDMAKEPGMLLNILTSSFSIPNRY